MIILGINAYHADSSACILRNGELLAAVEEERFKRIKHWAGFPTQSIKYCLREAGVGIEEIDHVALNRNPRANLLRKIWFILRRRPTLALIKDRAKNASTMMDIKKTLAQEFGVPAAKLKARISYVEHHMAHLASAFMVSPFEQAAVVSVDGFGDFVGAMWGVGRGNHLEVKRKNLFSPLPGPVLSRHNAMVRVYPIWGRIQGYGSGGLWRAGGTVRDERVGHIKCIGSVWTELALFSAPGARRQHDLGCG